MVLKEGSYRIRQGNGGPNLVILQPIALNLLRLEKPVKASNIQPTTLSRIVMRNIYSLPILLCLFNSYYHDDWF